MACGDCYAGNVADIAGPKGVWQMAAWANAYGPLYKMQFLDQFTLVLTDPDAIARITRRTGEGGGWSSLNMPHQPATCGLRGQATSRKRVWALLGWFCPTSHNAQQGPHENG